MFMCVNKQFNKTELTSFDDMLGNQEQRNALEARRGTVDARQDNVHNVLRHVVLATRDEDLFIHYIYR